MRMFFLSAFVVIAILFVLMCLGFLVSYIGNKQKSKGSKKAVPFADNDYIQAHIQMLKIQKEYESESYDLEPHEVEDHKKKNPIFNTDLDLFLRDEQKR